MFFTVEDLNMKFRIHHHTFMSEKRKLKHALEFREEHVREFPVLIDFSAAIARLEYPWYPYSSSKTSKVSVRVLVIPNKFKNIKGWLSGRTNSRGIIRLKCFSSCCDSRNNCCFRNSWSGRETTAFNEFIVMMTNRPDDPLMRKKLLAFETSVPFSCWISV